MDEAMGATVAALEGVGCMRVVLSARATL